MYKAHDASFALTNAQASALAFIKAHPGCTLAMLRFGAAVGEVPVAHLRRKGLIRVEGFVPGQSRQQFFAVTTEVTA